MNIFTLISFILATVVLYFGLRLASADLTIFVDFPSMFIVIGGSFASTAIGFKLNKILMLTKIYLVRILGGRDLKHSDVVKELILVIDKAKKGTSLSEIKNSVSDFFLKESLELIEDGILNRDEVLEVLELRRDNISAMYMDETSKLKSISKFPPAFGMIGTTIGMIVLLANLGGEDAMKMLGPAMGVCLITTLYGAVLANLLLIPMAENLLSATKEIHKKNDLIIQGVRMVLEKASPIMAAERLNSYLNPSERVDWKSIIQR